MGRGLSNEQRNMLKYVASNGFEDYGGCKVRVWNPDQCSVNREGTDEEWRQYKVDCASQSRTLHRLIDRGLLEKFSIRHYYSAEKHYGSVKLFRLTAAGLAVLQNQQNSNG